MVRVIALIAVVFYITANVNGCRDNHPRCSSVHAKRTPSDLREKCKQDLLKTYCPKLCGLCITTEPTGESTTIEPMTKSTLRKFMTLSTTIEPMTDSTMITVKPMETTTATVSPKDPQTSNGCGDKRAYCMMSFFNVARDCGKHRSNCPRKCGDCSSTDNQKCVNLVDRANDCSNRNCRASDATERHRAHVKCARYCCDRGDLQ